MLVELWLVVSGTAEDICSRGSQGCQTEWLSCAIYITDIPEPRQISWKRRAGIPHGDMLKYSINLAN
jgi:hypothetical protein